MGLTWSSSLLIHPLLHSLHMFPLLSAECFVGHTKGLSLYRWAFMGTISSSLFLSRRNTHFGHMSSLQSTRPSHKRQVFFIEPTYCISKVQRRNDDILLSRRGLVYVEVQGSKGLSVEGAAGTRWPATRREMVSGSLLCFHLSVSRAMELLGAIANSFFAKASSDTRSGKVENPRTASPTLMYSNPFAL